MLPDSLSMRAQLLPPAAHPTSTLISQPNSMYGQQVTLHKHYKMIAYIKEASSFGLAVKLTLIKFSSLSSIKS